MKNSEHESTAERAHRLWEEQGRPAGRDLEFWLKAERQEPESPDNPAAGSEGPPITNLDRALTPAQRQRIRAARQEASPGPAGPAADAPGHFIVVLDRAHLNIYQVTNGGRAARARFERIETVHLPAGLQHYTDRDTDQAGRFGARVGPAGGSIDERLPMQNEHNRRLAAELADRIGRFLQQHEHATWDYAAGPALHHAVLDRLPPGVRARLDRALAKELVHQSPAELEAHFTP